MAKKKPRKLSEDDREDAFDYYYGLGKDRTLNDVAERFGISVRTVAKWSTEHKWVERCAKMAAEDAVLQAGENVKGRYLSLLNDLVRQAEADFNRGKLKIKNILDLERVAKLHLALLDIPAEVISNEVNMTEDDRRLVDSLISEVKSGLSVLE